MIVAAIDIGTNSIRYMAARGAGRSVEIIDQGGEITRIGKNVDKTGLIAPAAARRTFRALRRFVNRCRSVGAEKLTVVATSALRDAKNGAAFVEQVRKKLRVQIDIVDGAEEARLAFLGVSHALPVSGKTLVIDIGGGSTELIVKSGVNISANSIDLGAVRLTERFLYGDPPKYALYKRMDTYVAGCLRKSIPAQLIGAGIEGIIGAGGTVTTLAAIKLMLAAYSHELVHGTKISAKEIESISDLLLFMPLDARKKVVGLRPERADIIVAGLNILRNIIALFAMPGLTVSDRGILYGMIINNLKTK